MKNKIDYSDRVDKLIKELKLAFEIQESYEMEKKIKIHEYDVIAAKDKELGIYARALELACETLNRVGVRSPYANFDYYMHQAEKEEEQE